MELAGAALWLVLAVPAVALVVLTGLGQRRRGSGLAVAVVAGLAFPVTWTAWYELDRLPRTRGALQRSCAPGRD